MDRRKGFTLIELLVVISIIALLMAILVPVIQAAKETAAGANCLSNQKTLTMAWFTYTVENDGKLVGGYVLGDDFSTNRSGEMWVDPPINAAIKYVGNSSNYTLEDEKRGYRTWCLVSIC